MGLECVINGYTAWSNVRLVKGDCESNDILKGLMHGRRLKVLLQGTGREVDITYLHNFYQSSQE